MGGAIENIPLPDLLAQQADIAASGADTGLRFRLGADTTTFQQVIFQHDYTGFFQLHFPNRTTDNGMMVRCVATHPEDTSQTVRSNWASLTLLGMLITIMLITLITIMLITLIAVLLIVLQMALYHSMLHYSLLHLLRLYMLLRVKSLFYLAQKELKTKPLLCSKHMTLSLTVLLIMMCHYHSLYY